MTSDPGSAPQEHLAARTLASYVTRARIALVVIGILYAWTAYNSYCNVRPFVDGSMFNTEPTGELKRIIDLAYDLAVFAGIASIASVVLAVVAVKRTGFAIYAAMGIFVVYTALRLYQTNGGYLSTWLWWAIAIVLGIGFSAAYKATQLRKSRGLADAFLVTTR